MDEADESIWYVMLVVTSLRGVQHHVWRLRNKCTLETGQEHKTFCSEVHPLVYQYSQPLIARLGHGVSARGASSIGFQALAESGIVWNSIASNLAFISASQHHTART